MKDCQLRHNIFDYIAKFVTLYQVKQSRNSHHFKVKETNFQRDLYSMAKVVYSMAKVT